MVRSTIVRSDRNGRAYAKGKYAVGICHRSGFKYPLRELKFEPGTNYFVHESENDGNYSLASHPQNFPPEDKVERIALRWTSRDVALSIGTVVSADDLFLPVFASVCNQWIETPSTLTWVCTGTGVSSGTYNLDFAQANNSMYLIVVFPGI